MNQILTVMEHGLCLLMDTTGDVIVTTN
uniref:Roadblock/LC7 domain-containing protein n=1 Tax=Heterorhabditis bacteriophora TaxID=37862 RepID=A0A1I7WL19_HETBA